jgi:flavin-dependent dehydrogenase
MYDIIIVGAGLSGSSFAKKISPFAKTLLIEANDKVDVRTNVFPHHNFLYLDNKDIKSGNKELFPSDHLKTLYLDKNEAGYIDSKNFGGPLGKIVYTDRLIKQLLKKYEENGGEIHFGEKVKKLTRTANKVEILTTTGQTYTAKVLVLATGSRAFELQRSLGFETPDSYLGIYTHLYGTEDQIQDNFDFDYLFHLNPNISKDGPFFFNVGRERILTGFLGQKDETEAQIVDKLDRILQNYKYIQPNLKNLTWDKSSFIAGQISKHPIAKFSTDRALVLGEAAGLVTGFFYEGLLSGLVSAETAANTLKPLLKEKSEFQKHELRAYDQGLRDKILDNYYKNGAACEFLFYDKNPSTIRTIWETYIKLIKENRKLRKQIWEAYRIPVEEYDTSRDKWAGEQLFKKLPALSKLSLSPKFLKALVKF